MASASFRSVGHVQPALWPRGCYCKHKGTEASAFYAKHTDFLHFYDAVHVPPFPCRLSVRHIGHRTHWAGSHFLESDSRLQLRSCACSIVPSPRTRPTGGKVHTRERCRPSRCHRMDFREKQCFFSKAYRSYLRRALFFCTSSIRRGAPKVNNQF